MKNMDLFFLAPPVISIITAIFIAGMAVYRIRIRLENILTSMLCILWSLLSIAYLAHRMADDVATVFMIERVVYVVFTFFPWIHIVYFHKLLGIRRKAMEAAAFLSGVFFSGFVFTEYYLTGVKQFQWGYYAQAGPMFWLFVATALITVIYVVAIVSSALAREENIIQKLKLKFLRFSFVFAALLTMLSALPMAGFNVYPFGYFSFIALSFLGYGILRYRLMGKRSMMQMLILWLIVTMIVLLPNILMFELIYPYLETMPPALLFAIIYVVFLLNFKFVSKTRHLVSQRFKLKGYDLKEIEASLFKDILYLKDTGTMIEEFRSMMLQHLGFSGVDVFMRGEAPGSFENTRKEILTIPRPIENWFVENKRIVQHHLMDISPEFSSHKPMLRTLLSERNAHCLAPLAQHDQLLGVAFFRDDHLNRLMTRSEIRFMGHLVSIFSITLYNSIIYHDISSLKDQLEEKTHRLSEEAAEREKAQMEIKKSHMQYKLLADNVKDTIWVIRAEDLRFTYLSPSVVMLLGYTVEEMLDLGLQDILTAESFEYTIGLHQKNWSLKDKELADDLVLELEHVKKGGERVWVEVSAHILENDDGTLSLIGVSRDITERRKAEEEKKRLEIKLLQAQKMESIGVLAGGIAHDFNNILMGILGYTELVKRYIPADMKEAHEKLARIEKASNRAKGMVAQILDFSRRNDHSKLPVQLAPVITEALKLLKGSLPSNISLVSKLDRKVPSVLADPVQIHQVVINLCSNASHAMEETGGVCTISLSSQTVKPEDTRDMNLPEGEYVCLSVLDTGSGMDQPLREKIFEPYFTTKEVGKGTGMGLSVVHGIVAGCGGKIHVDSEPGKGSCFRLYFPAAETSFIQNGEEAEGQLLKGHERILFVDDEKDIREFARECLATLGYRVTTSSDGGQALEFVKTTPYDFDLVITDLTMPGMSGERLALEIREVREDLPVILCTGYNMDFQDRKARELGIRDILIKPVPAKDLTDAIRNVLSPREPRE